MGRKDYPRAVTIRENAEDLPRISAPVAHLAKVCGKKEEDIRKRLG
jgi:hypothetical protein